MGMMLPKPVMSAIHDRSGNVIFRVGSSCVNGFRENMEDAHIAHLTPNWGFFGIFDGHVNDHCSKYLEEEWQRILPTLSVPITDERLKEISLAIDKKYLDNQPLGGSTATYFFALMDSNGKDVELQVGNVGDSRVLVCCDGTCLAMTNDHKPFNDDERARIQECNGHVENGRVNGSLAISRAFGDVEYKRGGDNQLQQQVIALPDVTRVKLSANTDDFALLACDGVFEGQFSNEEVIAFAAEQLKTESDLAIVANQVCIEAIKRGSKDNISCMIVQFKNGTGFGGSQHQEFVPGPISAPTHSGFRKAYWGMCEKAGFTVQQTLEMRYDALCSLTELDEELQQEKELFEQGPPGELKGEARTNWFSTVADRMDASGNQQSDAHSAILQLQRRGIPLSALVDALHAGADDN